MILCIDSSAITNVRHKVQSDINLEDILLNHTKYFDSKEEALQAKYAPLNFATTIRTVYTNEVLQITEYTKWYEKGKKRPKFKYYINLASVAPYVHKGLDLVMYLSSVCLMECVKYDPSFDELMFKHSTHQPIGLYNPNSGLLDPVIYSHIIIADEVAEKFKKYLKDGFDLVPISAIEARKDGNIPALLDKIIEVKGDAEHEQSRNNDN